MSESLVALGKSIRNLREKAGLTQVQLAKKARLSPKHLGEFERGRGNPSWSSIDKIVNALGASLSDMFLDYELEQLSIGEVRSQMCQTIMTGSDEKCRLAHKFIKALFT